MCNYVHGNLEIFKEDIVNQYVSHPMNFEWYQKSNPVSYMAVVLISRGIWGACSFEGLEILEEIVKWSGMISWTKNKW